MNLAESKGCSMALTLVLSVGLDAELLSTRNFVLQSAGYFVVPAYSLKEAVNYFQGGDFDLVLLCQSIPTKEKDRLTCWIRTSGSRIPVVSVSGKLNEDDHFAGITVGGNPEALLMDIREVLINAASPAVRMPASFDKKDAGVLPQREVAAEQGKKPPTSGVGYERQARTTKERSVPLAHVG